jgi:hypothetical protein
MTATGREQPSGGDSPQHTFEAHGEEAAMPKEARNEGKGGVLRQGAPKNRRDSEHEVQRRGETVRDTEGAARRRAAR